MGDKDLSEKMLMSHNDIFANIANVFGKTCFESFPVIHEEGLEDAPTESVFHDEEGMKQRFQDIAKYFCDGEIKLLLFGIENQTTPDPEMVWRIYEYEQLAYQRQRREMLQNGMNPLHNKIPTVYILVLYFGTEQKWNCAKKLSELVTLAPMNEYEIRVVELAWVEDDVENKLTGDFRELVHLLKLYRQKKDIHKYIEEGLWQKLTHVREMFLLIKSLFKTNIEKSFVSSNISTQEEDEKMVTLTDYEEKVISIIEQYKISLLEARAMLAGLEKGEARGEAHGRAEAIKQIINSLLDQKASPELIAKVTKVPVEEIQKLASNKSNSIPSL